MCSTSVQRALQTKGIEQQNFLRSLVTEYDEWIKQVETLNEDLDQQKNETNALLELCNLLLSFLSYISRSLNNY
jgi:hypothetical protein